jgi:predicted SAM-dependent methyltransferase
MAKKKPIEKEVVAEVPQVIGLELGCGQNKQTAEFFQNQMQIPVTKVIGVDFADCEGVDVVHNLTEFPYPFADESADAIFSSHFLEHLDGFERMKFFDECYRILKPKGKIRCVHPYYKSVRAIQDPTHKFPPISENSYLYWNKGWREANKLTHGVYDLKSDFDFTIGYTWQDEKWANKNEETRNFAINHYFNVIADLIVDLVKK